jgi:hypothetical protein
MNNVHIFEKGFQKHLGIINLKYETFTEQFDNIKDWQKIKLLDKL